MTDAVAFSQIVTSIATIFYSAVFAIGYYLLIKLNRGMLEANQQMLHETRELRISGGRPQIVVGINLSRLSMVVLAVRNTGGGPAKAITFDFSGPIEDSSGFVLSELPFFSDGINLLSSGDGVECVWEHLDSLSAFLREKGLHEGIAVTVRYRDLAEESYQTEWMINPLHYENIRNPPRKGVEDLVEALSEAIEGLPGQGDRDARKRQE